MAKFTSPPCPLSKRRGGEKASPEFGGGWWGFYAATPLQQRVFERPFHPLSPTLSISDWDCPGADMSGDAGGICPVDDTVLCAVRAVDAARVSGADSAGGDGVTACAGFPPDK